MRLTAGSAFVLAFLAIARLFAAQGGTGSIHGSVLTSATAGAPIKVTINENVCGQTQPDQSVVVGPAGGVGFAVVSLAGTKAVAEANEAKASSQLSLTNQHCRFSPRVQVARPGATVRITSDDQVLHTTHAYAEDDRSLFNIALPIAGMSFSRPLARARIVRFACDTHPWMRGFVVLTDEIAAVTATDGTFTLSNVPAGTYELQLWHEKLKAPPQRVTVAANQTTTVSLKAQ